MANGQEPLHLPAAAVSTIGPPHFTRSCRGCLRSPVWIGVIALLLDLIPKAMVMLPLLDMYKTKFGKNAYWFTTGSAIFQSLLGAPALVWLGHLSQPHRLGRKRVLLLLSIASTVSVAVPAVTSNVYVIISVQTLLALVGAGTVSLGMLNAVTSWITDWCLPSEKTTLFSVTQGALFGGMAVAPLMSAMLQRQISSNMFVVSFALKLLGPLYVLLRFPNDMAGGNEAPSPTSMRHQFSMSLGPHAPSDGDTFKSRVCKTLGHTGEALRLLLSKRFAATFCYMAVNFTDSAVQDTILLFLKKERHFDSIEVGAMMAVIGGAGCFIQCIGVPAADMMRMRAESMLLVGVICMVAHFAFYAFLTSKLMLIVLEPVGSMGYVASTASMALISGVGPSDAAETRDQGTLLGVLGGLRMLASCVGPLLVAGLNTNWQTLPRPFNWPGVSFGTLSFIMIPASALAAKLVLDVRRAACCVEA